MRLEAVFQAGFPYVQVARVGMLDDPLIDFEIRPLRSLDIMDVRFPVGGSLVAPSC